MRNGMVRVCGSAVTIDTFKPFFKMTRREVRLVSTVGRTWETWRRMNQLIETDRVRLNTLVSAVLPWEEHQQVLHLVKGTGVTKVLLRL